MNSTEKLKIEIQYLVDELVGASKHYSLFRYMRSVQVTDFYRTMKYKLFWNLTMQSHQDSAIIKLFGSTGIRVAAY